MPFHVTEATPDDISKLIDIYFAAFQDDFDLLIWPDTKSNRKWGSKGLLHDISDPDVLILKAVERVGNVDTIVSWASWELWSEEELESWTESGSESDSEWSSSSCSSESESESEEKSIEDTAESDCFYEKSWEMHRRYMKKSHWVLDLIATSPAHQRRGAASLLMERGLKRAVELQIEAYVEASPVAVPLYEKFGFRRTGRLEFKHKTSLYYRLAMVRSVDIIQEAAAVI